MWETILIGSVILFLINVIFWFIAVRIFSMVYQDKFDMVVKIIHEGMAERDAKLRVVQAMLTKAFVTDTRLFDILIEEGDESGVSSAISEEFLHGREKENQG
jgi:hypothetical protein